VQYYTMESVFMKGGFQQWMGMELILDPDSFIRAPNQIP